MREERAAAVDAAQGRGVDPAVVVELVLATIARSPYPVLGIGIGTPGLVDRNGTVRTAPNLGWTDVPLQALVAEATGLPVLVSNDSDAATQAELSASPGSEDMVLVHVGRGVGCGIVTGGRRVSGAHHAAGEIGHVTVGTDGGEDCPCGKRGCLETWLSIPRLRAALDSPDGHEVVEAGGERLGVALAPIVAALDLSEVVLAGPGGAARPGPARPRAHARPAPARGPRCPAVRPARRVTRRTSSCAAQRQWSCGTSSGSSRPHPNRTTPAPPAPPTTSTTADSTSTAPPTTTRTSVHTPGPTGPTARKEDRMIRRLPIVALTSAALVLTACASGGDSSDTPAATSSTSNAGQDDHPVARRRGHPRRAAHLPHRHVQGQDRCHPEDRGAGLARPRHQADHGPARRREHP